MLPLFIFGFLPHGIIGFIFVAIVAALMSTLDSGLNSLSAVTMKDFYQKYKPDLNERQNLIVSKVITLFWGIFCVGVAIILAATGEATRQTTIVLVNAVGSLLYGPILAAFLMGMWTKVSANGVKTGIISGVLTNIILWLLTPISWLWWNVTGFAVAFLMAMAVTAITGQKSEEGKVIGVDKVEKDPWKKIYLFMIGYFFLIIVICLIIQQNA